MARLGQRKDEMSIEEHAMKNLCHECCNRFPAGVVPISIAGVIVKTERGGGSVLVR